MIDNPLIKTTYNTFIKAKHNVYIADLMPGAVLDRRHVRRSRRRSWAAA